MPGTKNRTSQPPANARVRRAAHREREAANHRTPSPERQARLHPSRAERENQRAVAAVDDALTGLLDGTDFIIDAVATTPLHPLPWRAPDKKTGGRGWHVLDANGDVAEYARSRDKARARVREVNGS